MKMSLKCDRLLSTRQPIEVAWDWLPSPQSSITRTPSGTTDCRLLWDEHVRGPRLTLLGVYCLLRRTGGSICRYCIPAVADWMSTSAASRGAVFGSTTHGSGKKRNGNAAHRSHKCG